MAFSYRDNLRQSPNFAITGTEIPERLRRTLPPWTTDPPVIPSPNPTGPFGDPPRPPHDVDPPKNNTYNDPNYSPLIVTESLSARKGDEPVGGLPGMLMRAMMQQSPNTNSAPEHVAVNNGAPQGGLLGRLLALHDEWARHAPNGYGRDEALPQDLAAGVQYPVRLLSRR